MCKLYTLNEKNSNIHIATILDRSRKQETMNALTTAINNHFNTSIKISSNIDLTQCRYGKPLTIQVDIKEHIHNIGVSETSLY